MCSAERQLLSPGKAPGSYETANDGPVTAEIASTGGLTMLAGGYG